MSKENDHHPISNRVKNQIKFSAIANITKAKDGNTLVRT
jgi:hypothetical protein